MINIFPDKCVVLDLETTGNQARQGDQIIQIGLCVIENGEIVEQYATLVKPTKKIPAFIEKLTGITNDQVLNAPTIAEVIPELILKLENAALIAHNIHFDLGFLQYTLEDLGYPPFSGLIFDTVEMARILLPLQQGYRLEQLADDFDIVHTNPHQADSDAQATAQLFLALMNKMSELPLVTIQRLIPLARSLYSDLEVLLRRVERNKLVNPNLENEEAEWIVYRQLALRRKTEATEPSKLSSALITEDIYTSFDEIIETANPDYEYRAGQQELSLHILDAFTQGKHGLFEVGTGTGKTLAYLLSALLWAKQRAEKVVISTYTLVLQEQILAKEIPKLKKALPFHFSAQVLKGRNNYLCLRKFEAALFAQPEHNYDFILTKMKLLVWLTITETGDVEEINLPTGGKEFWQLVQSDSISCLRERCPWFKHCFYYRAKQRAQAADLIITNHALLLADSQVEHNILPDYQYLIIDEAHHLEYMATEQFGHSSQYRTLQFLINRLTLSEKNSFGQQILEFLPLVSAKESLADKIAQVASLAEELKIGTADLFTNLVQFAEEKTEGFSEGNIRQVTVKPGEESREIWSVVVEQAEGILKTMLEIKTVQDQFLEELAQEAELTAKEQAIVTDWKGMIERLGREIVGLWQFFHPEKIDEDIKWIEYELKGAKNSATVVQQPLQVSSILRKYLFEAKKSIILTSATLQINKSFDYIISELGIPFDRLSTWQIPSPFNYQEQATLLIPDFISPVGQTSEENFLRELAAELIDLAQLTQGRMLVLFTSYQSLRLTHRLIKDDLYSQGIFCFAQGIDSSSRGKLTKNFQSKEKAVLLGTSSFWEGIDIPGEDLSCLVIVKLPFSPPNTPYYQAKVEYLKAQGKNPFKDYALPQAIIRFKQGFGRLIRKQTDKGIIVVYDRRILEAGYGKLFIKSLPKIGIEQVDKDELREKVKLWLE